MRIALEPQFRDPGIRFEAMLFDGVRECVNACSFCFVRQLPRNLRESLYVRDDDFRLSFLHGNFITLTNLTDDDVARIITQRLSPLFVSLHAVDPGIRAHLIACRIPDRALERLEALAAGGIELHVQIVAVPGVNDGEALTETLSYLARLPQVHSVGVVPLGLTEHQSRFTASYDASSATELLALIAHTQTHARATRGRTWVYAADEFYLLSDTPFPAAEDYDGYPQYENGIGLVRTFIDEVATLPRIAGKPAGPVTLVTGTMFAPVLADVSRRIAEGRRIRVLPVKNRALGGNVGVAGLLFGEDIAAAIVADGRQDTYLVPDVVLNSDALTLDDMTVRDIRRRSKARVRIVGSSATDLARELALL